MRRLAIALSRSGQEYETRGGVAQSREASRRQSWRQQLLICERKVRGEHDDVRRDSFAVRGVHGPSPPPAHFDLDHGRAVPDVSAVLDYRAGECARDAVHSAAGKTHSGDAVHVRDDGVDRQCVVRRESGVHRLEGKQPARPRISQVVTDHRCQPAQSAQRDQPRQGRSHQVERRVERPVDEVLHFQAVELAGKLDESPVAVRLARSADPGDLLGHRLDARPHVEARPVREECSIMRVDRQQLEPIFEPFTDAVQRVRDQLGHGQHGRTGVERVPLITQESGPATRHVLALEQRDPSSGADQPQSGRQAG